MLKWIAGLVIALLLSFLYSFYLHKENQSLEQKIVTMQKESEQRITELNRSLLRGYEQDIARKQANEKAITSWYASQLNSLRQRLSRKDAEANRASTASCNCTGAQLYKEDGEFLAGEAARAERILEERNFCYGRYEESRKLIKEFTDVKN